MSEVDSAENNKMESKETHCENAAKDISTNSHADSMNDSQDFQLVDFEDETQKTVQDVESSQQTEEKVSLPIKAQDLENTQVEFKTDKEEVKSDDVPKQEASGEKVESDASNMDIKDETVGDEDDEVIPCTQTSSPSKKPILKRKADSIDEPPCKILRTTSREDALVYDKQLQEEETQCREGVNETVNEETGVIIAETQDAAGEQESIENNVAESEKKEEVVKDDKNLLEKHYEVDNNENLSTTEKAKVISEQTEQATVVEKNDNDSNTMEVRVSEKSEDANVQLEDEKTNVESNSNEEKVLPEPEKDQTSPEKDENIEQNSLEPKKDTNDEAKEKQSASPVKEVTNNTCKSRMSIEVIFDKSTMAQETKSKPTEVVEIDEQGEKIVLDSSQEDSDTKPIEKSTHDSSKADTTYKSCIEGKSSSEYSYKSVASTKESSLDTQHENRLVNGSTESKRCDTDSTASLQSDTFADLPMISEKVDNNIAMSMRSMNKQVKPNVSLVKDGESVELLSISENEPDVSLGDDINKCKSESTHSSTLTRGLQVEKEITMYVRLKCLLQVDEATKEYVNKEVTAVYCDATADIPLVRQKTNDTSSSLADISGNDNKEGSPGSVLSNAQMFPLNPSRLSCASTISSLSSVSSAASLAAKLALRDNVHFSLPRAPVKHVKKCYQDVLPSNDKQTVDETYERLTKEWQNHRLVTTTILNFANSELNAVDPYNVSNERIDDQLQKMRSSTPEAPKTMIDPTTPKSTQKGKAVKRPRSKHARAEVQSNGLAKISPKVLMPSDNSGTPNRKKHKVEHNETTINITTTPVKTQDAVVDELVGKEVFAKWSDNNYYPGTVVDKMKTKYKVHFYDGQNKVLIDDFIIPIPMPLKEGLSVYATTKSDDYGSCGIITDIHDKDNEIYYIVETDEGDKLRVQVKNIFLSSDQAQVLKEELNPDTKSLPGTPKHLGHVTLDNMVDGKRRSRRIATPSFSTPKSRAGLHTPKSASTTEPSVSGIASKFKKEKNSVSENEGASSDSNVSFKEETLLGGVQREIIGTPNVLDAKGPQSRIKSKVRNKKKVEDEETIALLGPVPTNSTLFKGMSFILTCVSLETIDKYQSDNKTNTGSEAETEAEEEWVKKPFVRERLQRQITEGGGKVYDSFEQIPQDQYKSTKLISNVPNTTTKALLCLSVGIPVYNHNWIIRCCQENKIVNPAEDELPVGWSLAKSSYVEMFQRPSSKPLTEVVVIIPVIESEKQSISFWRQICENAGAVVLLAEKSETMEGFGESTLVLANHRCPSWAVDRANQLQIPLLSTTYIVQCLVEGKLCPQDAHDQYAYNYIKN